MKNRINNIVSSFFGVLGGIVCFFFGGFLGGFIVNAFLKPPTTPEELAFNANVTGIAFIVVGLIAGFVGGMFIYYARRERGFADIHIKTSGRDW